MRNKTAAAAVLTGWLLMWAVQASAQALAAGQPVVAFNRIAVAPFLVVERKPEMDMEPVRDETLICTINILCVRNPAILTEAGPNLTRLADNRLRARFSAFNVVALLQARAAYDQIVLDESKDTPLSIARKLGESLNADFVLIGMVWRYRERGAVEAVPDSPASVAFALYLVQARDGLLVWRGSYEGTQEPVSQDLFQAGKRLKMGLQWLSVFELASHGMEQAFKSFPDNLQPVGGQTIETSTAP